MSRYESIAALQQSPRSGPLQLGGGLCEPGGWAGQVWSGEVIGCQCADGI